MKDWLDAQTLRPFVLIDRQTSSAWLCVHDHAASSSTGGLHDVSSLLSTHLGSG
jgi:hypothetical protein